MKKTLALLSLTLLISLSALGQKMNSLESVRTLEKKAAAVVKELSNNVEVSGYQQKSTIKVLIQSNQEQQKIENSNKGASQKTIALQELENKKEYALRGILNNAQYDMLVAIIEEK